MTAMETNYRLSKPALHYGLLLFIFGVGLLTILSHTVLHTGHTPSHNQPATASVISCSGQAAHNYTLSFTNKGIVPDQVTAHRCDELKLVNNSDDAIIAALGPHEHHIHYPGFEEKLLAHDQSYSFRLSEAGTFPLHDHDNDSLRATLIVKN